LFLNKEILIYSLHSLLLVVEVCISFRKLFVGRNWFPAETLSGGNGVVPSTFDVLEFYKHNHYQRRWVKNVRVQEKVRN
jgi:hypothetical protein